MVPKDDDFFSLFPMGEAPLAVSRAPLAADQPAAPPAAAQPSPSLLPNPSSPIDAIQLSSDSKSGVHEGGEDNESEVQREESIPHRVAIRRRAQFASFGDIL